MLKTRQKETPAQKAARSGKPGFTIRNQHGKIERYLDIWYGAHLEHDYRYELLGRRSNPYTVKDVK